MQNVQQREVIYSFVREEILAEQRYGIMIKLFAFKIIFID